MVLGGDGTILTAPARLRRHRRAGVRVNYGAIGFLATVEPWELEDGFGARCAGDFDVMELPGLLGRDRGGRPAGGQRRLLPPPPDGRVAELAYSVEGEQLGEVRCDGLVVSTPAGSTGYNLANGGPVLAWGVEGFVVSFIAPHTLTARALVVAPGDTLEVTNRSRARGGGRDHRRPAGLRARAGGDDADPLRAPRRCWPRRRARPSTTACATSSAGLSY